MDRIPDLSSEFDWQADWETERALVGKAARDAADRRSEYERDRARIVHSVAFRRLQGKTQIFAPSAADFMRTRITHSIEVAQIGRALATRFGVPESLVEAACLGHDLGHPPFGHTGEDILNRRMTSHGGYEGNAQTFRIVTYLERKSPDFKGLDLCRATLHGLIKYPYRHEAGGSKYIYSDDRDRFEGWLFDGLPHRLLTTYDPDDEPPRTLPCQLMDWADDIAYSVHDLEDGIASGMLQPDLWDQDWFLETICAALSKPKIRWQDGPPDEQFVRGVIRELASMLKGYEPPIPPDVVREMTRSYINKFATAGHIEASSDGTTLFDFKLRLDEAIRAENEVLKAITFEYVIDDARTRGFAYKGKEIIRRLFKTLLANTQENERARFLLFPREMRAELDAGLTEAELARAVSDYIASMTEGQAIHLYARLFEPHGGSPLHRD